MDITGEHWRIIVRDVMDGLGELPEKSVHCCVTSPPYFGLRDYGFDGQIGSEKTPEEFVATMVRVFGEVRRVLRDDGVLFLNLGDSYSGGDRSGGKRGVDKGRRASAHSPTFRPTGLESGNLIGIPWRVALALQADGWILRQCVCWAKRSPMPESVSGCPSTAIGPKNRCGQSSL